MDTLSETGSARRLACVSPRAGADPTQRAARSLARACQAELVVLPSIREVLALPRPDPILVLKRRARAFGGRPREDEADRSLCARLPCPVLLHCGDPSAPNAVVAAVALRAEEPTDIDRAVVLWGALLASWRRGRLHVVHGWSPIGESILSCPTRGVGARGGARHLVRVRRERNERMDALLGSCGLGADVPRVLGHGVPSKVIRVVAARARADLLVVGHRGRSGLGRLPGQPADAAWQNPCMSLLAIDVRCPRPDAVPFPRTPTR